MTTMLYRYSVSFFAAALVSSAAVAEANLPTENDFLADSPVVLSVTRLAQPLSETPGAVTIITREDIRRSGARELAEVLRLVPGYLVGGWNAANLSAVYHAPLDDERGQRTLLLIDGRRIYSSFLLGDTHHGMMGVLLDDIERIEVLRGSNSAAYGANAMFGVINVITRHSVDTTGTTLFANSGQNGIADYYASWGWSDGKTGVRFSAGKRADNGWRDIYDDKNVKQAHLRADMEPAENQQLMLAVDVSELRAGEGFPNDDTNGFHTVSWKNWSISGDWHWQYAADREIHVLVNYDNEKITDQFPLVPLPQVVIDQGGQSERWNLELSQQAVWSELFQGVWGLGYLNERAKSVPVYGERSPVSYSEWRLFGNLNWAPLPGRLNINLGGFAGWHSDTGSYFTPRLMANLQVADGHTLRAGVSEAVRTPTLFEQNANMLYYLDGELIGRYFSQRQRVKPERLRSDEVGYLGAFPAANLTIDVRAFRETLSDRLAAQGWDDGSLPLDASTEYVTDPYKLFLRGYESQTRWQPLPGTQLWFNQMHVATIRNDPGFRAGNSAPRNAMSLVLFQELPQDMNASLMFHRIGQMYWRGVKDPMPAYDRLDVRLAKKFKAGTTTAEAAVTVQALQGDYLEYHDHNQVENNNPGAYWFERRIFTSVRFQF